MQGMEGSFGASSLSLLRGYKVYFSPASPLPWSGLNAPLLQEAFQELGHKVAGANPNAQTNCQLPARQVSTPLSSCVNTVVTFLYFPSCFPDGEVPGATGFLAAFL